MSAERLYTPQMLAAAMELADYRPLPGAEWKGHARSPTCGSTLDVDLVLDEAGSIAQLGMQVRACAVGQATAAIFARHATGMNEPGLRLAYADLAKWLREGGAMPDWPDLALIAPAREYPGRHGAILLPWMAALDALSSDSNAG